MGAVRKLLGRWSCFCGSSPSGHEREDANPKSVCGRGGALAAYDLSCSQPLRPQSICPDSVCYWAQVSPAAGPQPRRQQGRDTVLQQADARGLEACSPAVRVVAAAGASAGDADAGGAVRWSQALLARLLSYDEELRGLVQEAARCALQGHPCSVLHELQPQLQGEVLGLLCCSQLGPGMQGRAMLQVTSCRILLPEMRGSGGGGGYAPGLMVEHRASRPRTHPTGSHLAPACSLSLLAKPAMAPVGQATPATVALVPALPPAVPQGDADAQVHQCSALGVQLACAAPDLATEALPFCMTVMELDASSVPTRVVFANAHARKYMGLAAGGRQQSFPRPRSALDPSCDDAYPPLDPLDMVAPARLLQALLGAAPGVLQQLHHTVATGQELTVTAQVPARLDAAAVAGPPQPRGGLACTRALPQQCTMEAGITVEIMPAPEERASSHAAFAAAAIGHGGASIGARSGLSAGGGGTDLDPRLPFGMHSIGLLGTSASIPGLLRNTMPVAGAHPMPVQDGSWVSSTLGLCGADLTTALHIHTGHEAASTEAEPMCQITFDGPNAVEERHAGASGNALVGSADGSTTRRKPAVLRSTAPAAFLQASASPMAQMTGTFELVGSGSLQLPPSATRTAAAAAALCVTDTMDGWAVQPRTGKRSACNAPRASQFSSGLAAAATGADAASTATLVALGACTPPGSQAAQFRTDAATWTVPLPRVTALGEHRRPPRRQTSSLAALPTPTSQTSVFRGQSGSGMLASVGRFARSDSKASELDAAAAQFVATAAAPGGISDCAPARTGSATLTSPSASLQAASTHGSSLSTLRHYHQRMQMFADAPSNSSMPCGTPDATATAAGEVPSVAANSSSSSASCWTPPPQGSRSRATAAATADAAMQRGPTPRSLHGKQSLLRAASLRSLLQQQQPHACSLGLFHTQLPLCQQELLQAPQRPCTQNGDGCATWVANRSQQHPQYSRSAFGELLRAKHSWSLSAGGVGGGGGGAATLKPGCSSAGAAATLHKAGLRGQPATAMSVSAVEQPAQVPGSAICTTLPIAAFAGGRTSAAGAAPAAPQRPRSQNHPSGTSARPCSSQGLCARPASQPRISGHPAKDDAGAMLGGGHNAASSLPRQQEQQRQTASQTARISIPRGRPSIRHRVSVLLDMLQPLDEAGAVLALTRGSLPHTGAMHASSCGAYHSMPHSALDLPLGTMTQPGYSCSCSRSTISAFATAATSKQGYSPLAAGASAACNIPLVLPLATRAPVVPATRPSAMQLLLATPYHAGCEDLSTGLLLDGSIGMLPDACWPALDATSSAPGQCGTAPAAAFMSTNASSRAPPWRAASSPLGRVMGSTGGGSHRLGRQPPPQKASVSSVAGLSAGGSGLGLTHGSAESPPDSATLLATILSGLGSEEPSPMQPAAGTWSTLQGVPEEADLATGVHAFLEDVRAHAHGLAAPVVPCAGGARRQQAWHRIRAFVHEPQGSNPATGQACTPNPEAGGGVVGSGNGAPRRLLVLVHEDVTQQVLAERRMVALCEHEFKVLEPLFPRHVLQYLLRAAQADTAASAAAAAQQPAGHSLHLPVLAAPRSAYRTPELRLCERRVSASGGAPARQMRPPRTAHGQGGNASLTHARGELAVEEEPSFGCQIPGRQVALLRRQRMLDTRKVASLATQHRMVTVLFSDIVGFTSMCKQISPLQVMAFLNQFYKQLDDLLDVYRVYKVETIGDCYMVCGGLVRYDEDGCHSVLPEGEADALHAVRVMAFAKAMLRISRTMVMPTDGSPLRIRIGLHSGPVVSGMVGSIGSMPRFCLFGGTVDTAHRMEADCQPGRIHVSAATRELLASEGWEPAGATPPTGTAAAAAAQQAAPCIAGAGCRGGPQPIISPWKAAPVAASKHSLRSSSNSSGYTSSAAGAAAGAANSIAAAATAASYHWVERGDAQQLARVMGVYL